MSGDVIGGTDLQDGVGMKADDSWCVRIASTRRWWRVERWNFMVAVCDGERVMMLLVLKL